MLSNFGLYALLVRQLNLFALFHVVACVIARRRREDALPIVLQSPSRPRVQFLAPQRISHLAPWSEVEYDLVYKPLDGDFSGEEYALLDQLNGLAISAEIALENLQKA